MSGGSEDQHAQTPSKPLRRLEEAFVLVDPSDWGRPRSEYAKRRAQKQPKIELSDSEIAGRIFRSAASTREFSLRSALCAAHAEHDKSGG